MDHPVVVILGAGASRDCSSPDIPKGGPIPPLVTDLFSPAYMEILGRYPSAQAAGAEIRKAGKDAAAVEQFIRERYRRSQNPLDRRKYMAIPCYLQDLLHRISTTYTTQPDNYDLLVAALTRLPDVVLVTLNYDTLLDDRLHTTVERITSLDAYIDSHRKWSLIKLHGSVNWGRLINDASVGLAALYDPDPDLPIDDEITWRGGFGAELEALRRNSDGLSYYPALAVPVGEEDELVCPAEHVDFLKAKLRDAGAIHLLVIGYSGNDREVIRVVQDSGAGIRSLYVVNADAERAQAVAHRLGPEFGIGVPIGSWCDVPFGEFAQSDRLEHYLDRLANG